jgi:hypothetical protein
MRKVESFGSVKNGVMKISYRDKFTEAIRSMPDCAVKITVEKKYKKRSTYTYNEETGKEGRGQSGYYWFVICGLFVEGWRDLTGELIDKPKAHERLKMYCNYEERAVESTGEIIKIPKSTADQTTVEAEEFYERCRQWMLENMNVTVPLPNEKLELELQIKSE